MAERRTVEAINWEFELPEHIIQRIQFFLTRKAAAQTSVLSKSWRRAWLTRPNIDFDYQDFPNNGELLELANNTIQRYEESNLKIESFRLCLCWPEDYDFHLANTLILKALKLCAYHLCFETKQEGNGQFVIPRDVFESENLLGLSVEGCSIDIGMDYNVRCSKLKSLSLKSVVIDHYGVILNIISSCSLIENLSLSRISEMQGFTLHDPINLPKMHNLKCLMLSGVELDTLFFRDMSSKFPSLKDLTLQDFYVGECTFDVGMDQNVRCSRLEFLSLHFVEIQSRDMISKIILSCPLIENMSLSKIRDKQYDESVMRGPVSLPKLNNIKCLVLRFVKFDTLFLYDLSSKFPFLKDLTVNAGFWRSDEEVKVIQISSHSLEHLNLAPNRVVIFEFDIPSIRKFTFEGWFFPLVSFKSTSREWESHISIKYRDTDPLGTSWFLALNELLTALIPSKIYLSISGGFKTCFSYEVVDIQGLPLAEVENLTVDIRYLPTLNCYALFDGIFRACRPKFVTQYLLPDSGKTNSDFLCKRLAQGVNGEFSSPTNFMYGLNGLEEVNVQVFDEFVAVRKDLPCKSLLDQASKCPEEKKNIRFQLVWKP